MRPFLFQFIIAKRPAGRLDQAGIHGNPFVNGKPLGLELAQDLGVLPRYRFKLFFAMVV